MSRTETRPPRAVPLADPYTLADPARRLLSHRPALGEVLAEWLLLAILGAFVLLCAGGALYLLKSAVGLDLLPLVHAKELLG